MAGAPGRPGQLQWTDRGERTSGATHGPGAGLELRSEMKALEGLPLGATRSECVSRRCPWLQVEGGLQGAHGSCWGLPRPIPRRRFPAMTSGRPHSRQELQLPILRRWKLRPWEEKGLPRVEVRKLFRGQSQFASSLAPCPSPRLFLSLGCVWGSVSVLKTEDPLSSFSQESGLWSQRA